MSNGAALCPYTAGKAITRNVNKTINQKKTQNYAHKQFKCFF